MQKNNINIIYIINILFYFFFALYLYIKIFPSHNLSRFYINYHNQSIFSSHLSLIYTNPPNQYKKKKFLFIFLYLKIYTQMTDFQINIRSNNHNWKVRIYVLNSEGNWEDAGTGTLQIVKEMNPNTELEEDYFKVSPLEEF